MSSPSFSADAWSTLNGLATVWLGALVWLSVAATAVFLVVYVLRRLLPARAAFLRHGLLSLVLLRLVLPPHIESPWSLWTLVDDWRIGTKVEGSQDSASILGSYAVATRHHSRIQHSHVQRLDGTAPAASASAADQSAEPQTPWALALLVLWGFGAGSVGWRFARQRRKYRSFIDGATPLDQGPLYELTERYRRLFRLRRPIRVVISEAPVMPFTLGIRRPVILFPSKLAGSGVQEPSPGDRAVLESILAHELAHIQRLDDLWLKCQNILQAIYFFHPVVWMTSLAMNHDRELDCDQRAIHTLSFSPRGYGEAFLHLLSLDLSPSDAASAFAGRRRLKMRLKNILDTRPVSSPRRRQACLLVAIGLAVLPWAVTGEPQPTPAPEALETERSQNPPSRELTLFDLMPGSRITSTFGPQTHPIDGTEVHHDGVDLSTGVESSIYAPRGGVVKVATDFYAPAPKMGKVVIIDHGSGIETLYAHLATIAVEEKSGVSDGELLGKAGETGVASGPHLHFEIHKDGELVDPVDIAEWIGDC